MIAAKQANPDKRVTLWFQDEARIGQKGRVCHRWWTRGQRPPGLCDRRYTWVHLFGAVRPADGDRFALVMPVVSTQAMSLFLEGFASRIATDEHAVMVLDRAGWHRANALRVPDNVTLVPLPSYSPEPWGIAPSQWSGCGCTCASAISRTACSTITTHRRCVLRGLEPTHAEPRHKPVQLSLHPTSQTVGSTV